MLQFDFASAIALFTIAVNLSLLVSLLFRSARDFQASLLLVLVIVCLIALVINQLYRYLPLRLFVAYPHFSGYSLVLLYCLAPAIYLYIRKLFFNEAPAANRYWFVHWIFPLAVACFLIPHFGRTTAEKIAAFRSVDGRGFRALLLLICCLQIGIYNFYCHKAHRIYQRRVSDFPGGFISNGVWLIGLNFGVVGVLVLTMVLSLNSINNTFISSLGLIGCGFISAALALWLWRLRAIPYTFESDNQNTTGEAEPGAPKYSRSGLQEDSAKYYLDRLQQAMTQQQCFLDEKLSLGSLAKQLNMSGHHLSQLLNEQLHTTFYDYVNNHRIEYAKSLIIKDPQLAVIDIAYASGYTSKSTFYTAFKRRLGMTPVQYRNNLTGGTQ